MYRVGMTEKRIAYRVWWRNLMERDHLEDLGVDRKIELKEILNRMREDLGWLIWLMILTSDMVL